MDLPARLREIVREQSHPILFATVSGAHLYGFPSPDSDWDLRGVHVLPPREVLGLDTGRETVECSRREASLDLDLVTHDVLKFFRLLLRPNGYVLEQLHSPLVVHTTPAHEELRRIAQGCVTRHHAHHYLGFFRTQWGLLEKAEQPRVKPLLYAYRVLLTGIHLMRTGLIEADLPRLAADYGVPGVDGLIARKIAGAEAALLGPDEVGCHREALLGWVARLEREEASTTLPDGPSARPALHDLLLRVRLDGLERG